MTGGLIGAVAALTVSESERLGGVGVAAFGLGYVISCLSQSSEDLRDSLRNSRGRSAVTDRLIALLPGVGPKVVCLLLGGLFAAVGTVLAVSG